MKNKDIFSFHIQAVLRDSGVIAAVLNDIHKNYFLNILSEKDN